MSQNVSIDNMDDVIMKELEKYANLATDDMKDAVKDTANSVRKISRVLHRSSLAAIKRAGESRKYARMQTV